MVEHHVANVIVAGSTPVTRSKFLNRSGRLAQSVEQGTENPRVPSSILGPATIFLPFFQRQKNMKPEKASLHAPKVRFMARSAASYAARRAS